MRDWYNSVAPLFVGRDSRNLVGKVIFSATEHILVLLPPEHSRK